MIKVASQPPGTKINFLIYGARTTRQSFKKRKIISKPHTIQKNKLQMYFMSKHNLMKPYMY